MKENMPGKDYNQFAGKTYEQLELNQRADVDRSVVNMLGDDNDQRLRRWEQLTEEERSQLRKGVIDGIGPESKKNLDASIKIINSIVERESKAKTGMGGYEGTTLDSEHDPSRAPE